MAKMMEEGWQIVCRTPFGGELNPCYFCSPNTPKFFGGWEVRLADQRVVTVGPECGRKHLGERFTTDRRVIEQAEDREKLINRRAKWLAVGDGVEETARNILEHIGLVRLLDIKEQTHQLSNSARKFLEKVAAGVVPGVGRFPIFAPGGPRREAKALVEGMAKLRRQPGENKDLRSILQQIDEAARDHNLMVPDYAQGMKAFSRSAVRNISRHMPDVAWDYQNAGNLVLRRISDGLTKQLPLPESLDLGTYFIPV